MKKNLIVKDNVLINASYYLDLIEQRLILLAIIEARQNSIPTDKLLTVHAERYASQFNVHQNTAYQALKDASENLFERRFSYQKMTSKGNIENVKSRWVQRISYVENEALVRLQFSDDVVPLITNLEKHFTRYELEQVSKLTSIYAVRLYELIIQWRGIFKTPVFEINQFRTKLGVKENEYKLMHQFKQRVLNLAITQINKNTDITVDYKQYKQGRVITGFSFQFKQKKKRKPLDPSVKDQNTANTFYHLTDAQINSFGNQLSQLQELSYLANTGESYSDLAIRIKNMLKDPQTQPLLHPYLQQLGFSKKGN